MTQSSLFAQIRHLIACEDLPAALSLLRGLLEHTPQLNEALQQSGRLESIRRDMQLGIVSDADARLEQNHIRYGILELLGDIERQGLSLATLRHLLRRWSRKVREARPEKNGNAPFPLRIVRM